MRKIVLLTVSFLIVIVASHANADEPPKLAILFDRFSEHRSIILDKSDREQYSEQDNRLDIILTLIGPAAADAARYGEPKLTEVVDDTGKSLIAPRKAHRLDLGYFGPDIRFREFSNARYIKSDQEFRRPLRDPEITITLAPAARNATKIARFRGSISITNQGALQTVDLAGLKLGDKKKMDIPATLGVSITAHIKDGRDLQRGIEALIAGQEDLIDSIEVHDAAGKKVGGIFEGSAGYANNVIKRYLYLDKPFDESMKIVARLVTARDVTEIPFDFKDLFLPHPAASFAETVIQVRPHSVYESRYNNGIQSGTAYTDLLSLRLILDGMNAMAATQTHYGYITIDGAIDDTGTTLALHRYTTDAAPTFREFGNASTRKANKQEGRPVPDPLIYIQLTPPQRNATKIARLRGSVSVADPGTLKTFELANLKPGEKKKMDIPKDTEVSITTNIPDAKDIKTLQAIITGRDDAIESLEIQNAQGKNISRGGRSRPPSDGSAHYVLILEKPLDETMKLVAKIRVDRNIIKIPFDLKDIELP